MRTYLYLYLFTRVVLGIILPIILIIIGVKLLRNPKRKVHIAVPILLFVISGVFFIVKGIMRVGIVPMPTAFSTSIIGGSDGPTSIFLAGRIGVDFHIMIAAILLLLIGIYIRGKKKIPFLKKYDGVRDIPLYCKSMGGGVIAEAVLLLIGGILSLHPAILILGSIGIAIGTLVVCKKAM